jgi:hypothetical protein
MEKQNISLYFKGFEVLIKETKVMEKQNISLQFKGFEILIQESFDGVIVDVYHSDENASTGLLGSTYVFFDEQNAQDKLDEKPHGYGTG